MQRLNKDTVLGPDIIYVVRCHAPDTWVLMADTTGNYEVDQCWLVVSRDDGTYFKEIDVCQCPEGDEDA